MTAEELELGVLVVAVPALGILLGRLCCAVFRPGRVLLAAAMEALYRRRAARALHRRDIWRARLERWRSWR